METARFQVVRGTRTGARLSPPWPVVQPPAPDDVRGESAWYGWRLLSRNHRDLARSPQVHASVPECLTSIEALRALAAEASTVLAKNPSTGRWTWRLEAPGSTVAVSSRGYLRRRECHECVAQVVALAAVAGDPDQRIVVPARAPVRTNAPPEVNGRRRRGDNLPRSG